MKACGYEKYYSEYIRGDLPPDLDLTFHRHIMDCPVCAQELDRFYAIHRRMNIIRPPSPAPLSEAYHRTLQGIAEGEKRRPGIRGIIHEVIFTRSRILRLAEVVTLLLVGVLIGWYFFYDHAGVEPSLRMEAGYYGKPISKQDMEYLNYYFLASEMVLLEMANGEIGEDDFILERQTAQKLLIKTFLVHEVALKLNDPRMLKFLTRMELILYEIANADEEQLDDTFASVRFIIDEARLLSEVRALKELIESRGTPALMPG